MNCNKLYSCSDRLFNTIVFYEQHLLHWLLPERHYTNYNLRSRRHDRTLLANTDRRNFIHRRMILNIFTSFTVILFIFVLGCGLTTYNKDLMMIMMTLHKAGAMASGVGL